MARDLLLALDQGTSSTRALLFDAAGAVRAAAQRPLRQIYPRPGWVEHDAEEIAKAAEECCQQALAAAGARARDVAALGLTNQRETIVLWERASGRPVHHALVWQDRRTAEVCHALRAAGVERFLTARTGLLLDPYFSATKLAWLLEHVEGARRRAERGELLAGTIDSFLLFRLTRGAVHATDATNASRTLLFDIRRQQWDEDLLTLFGVPPAILPEVRDCAADYGELPRALLGGSVRIAGVAGDQQAAAIGQACWAPGLIKATYGTGAFVLLTTGERAAPSRHRLLTTVAHRLSGRTAFALEGSIFSAGSTIQWLRDELGLLESAAQSEELAARSDGSRPVYLVPAFTGLGAPHWDAGARGAILGLTRDTTAADVVRAGLEAVAYQTADLLEAMAADGGAPLAALRVDGGMSTNDWLMQRLADLVGLPVERPALTETTALGAALLAGLAVGLYSSPRELEARWQLERSFLPTLDDGRRKEQLANWRRALARVATS